MERLREYMTEKGLTQAQLAAALKKSQPTISDWLSGNIKPSADSLVELSEYTGLSVDELLVGNSAKRKRRPS